MSLSILDLPTEVIAHIFSFILHQKDRRNLALVCKKSHKIVRQQSKKYNSINLASFHEKTSLLSIFEQSDEFPFQKLKISNEFFAQFRDLWFRHGSEITQINLMNGYKLNPQIGNYIQNLFPNLTVLIQETTLAIRSLCLLHKFIQSPENIISKFSTSVEELHLYWWEHTSFNWLESILMLFPGLKRLNLEFRIRKTTRLMVQKFKSFLNKWLLKLDRIELSFQQFPGYHHVDFDLLRVFDQWSHEKLFFDEIVLNLTKTNVEIFQGFFSVARRIKTLWVFYQMDIVQTAALFALIDENATIDHLFTVGDNAENFASLEGLFNARGIKEIHMRHGHSVLNDMRLKPETLLKVVELLGFMPQFEEEPLKLPLFRNLRILNLCNEATSEDELQLIINTFPLLEDLIVIKLLSSNVGFSNLKYLQSLNFDFAPNLSVSDEFYESAFNLPNLKHLSIHGAPDLTLTGIKSIVSNCPMIETMYFSKCDKINEACFEFIAQKLFYIRTIKLAAFGQLSPECIERLQKTYPHVCFMTDCL